MGEKKKVCKKCGRELPISEFNKDKHRKDGLDYRCRECNKKRLRKFTSQKIQYIESEQWKAVVGYEGLYEVSNYGRVRSLGRIKTVKNRYGNFQVTTFQGRLMVLGEDKDGYRIITLTDASGCQTQHRVHILVAEAFIPNPNGYDIVHHINRNKKDNNTSNLEWLSKENHYNEHAIEIDEALRKVERPKGEKHPFYGKKRPEHAKKLSIPIVEIKEDGTILEWESTKICAEKYGYNAPRLTLAVNGKNRKRGHYYKTSQFYKKADYEKMLEEQLLLS